MNNKKGIGAIFAWIFVLIAGALIITLFVVLAQGQASNAQAGLSLQALQSVNTILSTQQTSGDVNTNIDIPASEIRLTCAAFIDQNSDSVALLNQLEIGGFPLSIENQLISGRDMVSTELILFSKEWKAPFSAGNILYISGSDDILAYDGPISQMDQFEDMIPENVNSHRTFGPINADDYDNARYVHFGIEPTASGLGSIADSITNERSALLMNIEADSTANIGASGEITIYEYNSQNGEFEKQATYPYVGEAMLFAYIWQADKARADCMQHKLAQTLLAQVNLHDQRRALIEAEYLQASASSCAAQYSATVFQTYRHILQTPNWDFETTDEPMYSFIDQASQTTLALAATNLNTRNENILRGDRCAPLY